MGRSPVRVWSGPPTLFENALVAQLVSRALNKSGCRAIDFESIGCRFESCRAHSQIFKDPKVYSDSRHSARPRPTLYVKNLPVYYSDTFSMPEVALLFVERPANKQSKRFTWTIWTISQFGEQSSQFFPQNHVRHECPEAPDVPRAQLSAEVNRPRQCKGCTEGKRSIGVGCRSSGARDEEAQVNSG
jgi:hypothetical protein